MTKAAMAAVTNACASTCCLARAFAIASHSPSCSSCPSPSPYATASCSSSSLGSARLQSGPRFVSLRAEPLPLPLPRKRKWQVCAAAKKAASVGVSEFESVVLKSEVPVLVDFWAEWCGPCKLVAPLMDWAAQQYDGQLQVVKVEAGRDQSLLERYGIYGLPALIIFKDGQEVSGSRKEGAISRQKLEALINDILPTLVSN